MANPTKPQLRNLQGLRAIAAIMVVFAHIGGPTGTMSKLFGPSWAWAHVEILGRTGVDLFFVISGFIMVVTTSNVVHGARGARTFLWRRITRVYPPYLVVTAFVFVLYEMHPDVVNSSQATRPDVIASFLLLPQAGLPLLLVGWTLVFEMYFYLVFTIGLLVPKRVVPVVLGVWVAVTIGASALAAAHPSVAGNPYVVVASSPLNFEFLFGVVVGWVFVSGRALAPAILVALGAGGTLAIWVAQLAGIDVLAGSEWLRVGTSGVAYALLVCGLVQLERDGLRPLPRPLVSLGDSSYSLYLTHVLTLKIVLIVVTMIGLRGLVGETVDVVIAVGASLLAGIVFYRVVESPLMALIHQRKNPKPVPPIVPA